MALKWGIAAAGCISNDFANALSTLPTDEHEITAVAASNGERAKQFALRHGIPKSYEGYENLATDPDIDVVYIGALNPQHYEIAMMMLENKKNVLCEKPLCMNEKQARKLITYATSKKLFIMEAIWSRFFPSYQYLKKQIDNNILGEIQEVNVTFGFHLADVERLNTKSQGGGTILDLGVYAIQISQWAFREPPMSIKATGKLNAEGVDLEMEAELTYSGNRKAHLKTSAYEQLENKAYIKGTKGQIVLNDFWCPIELIDIDGTTKTWPLPKTEMDFNFHNSCGLRYEAEEVRRCIKAKRLQSDQVSHNESLTIAKIQDEMRQQIGVKFPEDLGLTQN